MKEITVLGSTGSIGTQTLEVVRANPDYKIQALAAGSNIELLEKQIREFKPRMACLWEAGSAAELQKRITDCNTEIVYGIDGMTACATLTETGIVVAAVVGMIGIQPVIEAVKAGKDIAFANKETLVTAGHLIMPLVKENNVAMLPVDSEHAAIFQCLHGEKKEQVSKIILTASGGPFRGKSLSELEHITVEEALQHPNWSMGKKITIDSSTMANKGLEVMEAKWLFDTPLSSIQVVLQPQSLIHSMVEFIDGAVMAQLGTPDMKLPIQYALSYPERRFLEGERVDFAKLGQITFEEPDMENFPCLKMAYEAGEAGGSMPTVFNAANEKAVELFLHKKIGYTDIMRIIDDAMMVHHKIENPSLAEILQVEKEVYERIDTERKVFPV